MIPPEEIRKKLPLTASQQACIQNHRATIQRLIRGEDSRIALVFGPCSIHDLSSALEYARRFRTLSEEVRASCFCVMRVYVEKPRTEVGWKGLVYDPHLDGSNDLQTGIFWARELFLTLTDLGIPIATELLNPLFVPFFSDLISWGFIGARTSASQIHREIASSVPFPIGFKNSIDGNIGQTIQAMRSALSPHRFPTVSPQGKLSVQDSPGNPWTHVVLRGSSSSSNYDPFITARTATELHKAHFKSRILIDCSHGNSCKTAHEQPAAFASTLHQFLEGSPHILGMMLESHLEEGSQTLSESPSTLQYGQSVTDPCLSWSQTEGLIRDAHQKISQALLTL